MSDPREQSFPIELADLCVKCGLCLPHCPTYQITENEAESPRGRIALMQGVSTGMLEASGQVSKHLDQCLTCRACEPVCPAQVPYGELIDQGRAMMATAQPTARSNQLLTQLLIRPSWRRLAARLLQLYQRLGIQSLTRNLHLLGSGKLARLESFLPPIPSLTRPVSSATATPSRGRVALFTGCVSEWFESDVLIDAVALLNACGFDVDVPKAQGCCGALFQHQGELTKGKQLAEQNIKAFAGDYIAILGTASGCTSMLSEYRLITDKGAALSDLSQDISQFLLEHWPADLTLQPLDAEVAIQDPCSLRNVLKTARAPYDLLEKIPGIRINPLNDNGRCCGAAGNYFISQPDMADELGRKKREALEQQRPDILLSSNVGCSTQLKAQLRQADISMEVLHPISLLRRQLVLTA